jgi:hypothetical protein
MTYPTLFNPELMRARMLYNRAVMTGDLDLQASVRAELEATLARTLENGQAIVEGVEAQRSQAIGTMVRVAEMMEAMDPLAEAKTIRDQLEERIPVLEGKVRERQWLLGVGCEEGGLYRRRLAELRASVQETRRLVEERAHLKARVHKDICEVGQLVSKNLGGMANNGPPPSHARGKHFGGKA